MTPGILITGACYIWALAFLVIAFFTLIKDKDKTTGSIAFTVFGNCFSIVFWITTAIANSFGIALLPDIMIYIIALFSIILLIVLIGMMIYLRKMR